jgi:hypothetical protein
MLPAILGSVNARVLPIGLFEDRSRTTTLMMTGLNTQNSAIGARLSSRELIVSQQDGQGKPDAQQAFRDIDLLAPGLRVDGKHQRRAPALRSPPGGF